jgi:tetratricopeptide (TPR) repeat protein
MNLGRRIFFPMLMQLGPSAFCRPARRFAALSALSFSLFVFVREPACAGPSGVKSSSSSSDTAKLARAGGLAPLTKEEQDNPAVQGRRLISRGDYSRALFVLQSNIDGYVNRSPKNPMTINVGDWHADTTGQNLALRELSTEQLLRIHFSDVYNLRGINFICMKRIPDAAESFRKAIECNPFNGVALGNLSSAYFRQGRFDDAIAAAKKALQISDRFLDSHSSLATIYRAKNQFDLERKELEALNRCRKLKAKDNLNLADLGRSKFMYDLISPKPQSAKKQIAMGVIYKQLNNLTESEKCHLAGIKLDGKLVEAHWSYGLLLMAQQKYADAIREFTLASSLDSTYAMPYFHRAESYFLLKKYREAMADYSKFLEVGPKSSALELDAYFSRASCHGHLKEYAAGIKDLNKTLGFKITPALKAAILSNRGTLYEGLGNKTQALKDYEAAMELAPNDKVISGKRGKIMLLQGEYEQATVDLSNSSKTEVAEVSKEPPSVAELKAQIAHYDKLIRMFPRTAVGSLYNRGLLYLTMGDAAKAAADMQAVVAAAKECNDTADYAVCYGGIALRMQNKAAEADNLLLGYSKKSRSLPAPPVVEYFLNRPPALVIKKLMVGDSKQRTRVLTLAGLDCYSRNDKNNARKFLSLVRNSGEPSMDEFALAVSYLKRLGQN